MKYMLRLIDNFLNSITMYQLVLRGLVILTLISFILSLFNALPFTPIQMGQSLIILLASCYLTNWLMARLLKAPTNYESYLITALILFLILSPIMSLTDLWITLAAGIMAMASKYVFAIRMKHIFNPVAITLVILGLLSFGNAIWWVGSVNLLLPVLVLGLLIVRKVRRFYLFSSFLIAATITLILFNLRHQLSPLDTINQLFTSWPLLFFGSVMLTEPLTTPPTQKLRLLYGIVVGILFGSQFSFGIIHASPELALVIGNIISYLISPKQKLFLQFKNQQLLAKNTYELAFKTNQRLDFKPGQYLEWTLPHHQIDSRGNRRYFTIASSPTEIDIKLGVKTADLKSSSFKKALTILKPGQVIVAGQLSGDFVLPDDPKQPLVFIAGGIGVTPFRSMIKYLIDTQQSRDITLFYSNKTEAEIAYRDLWKQAEAVGVKTVFTLTDLATVPAKWSGQKGVVDKAMLQKFVPNYQQQTFYLSGPHGMVTAFQQTLAEMSIPANQIKIDYFPGFA